MNWYGQAMMWKRPSGRYDVWTSKPHTGDKAECLGVDLRKREALKLVRAYNRALYENEVQRCRRR